LINLKEPRRQGSSALVEKLDYVRAMKIALTWLTSSYEHFLWTWTLTEKWQVSEED
jgi:hypothetical protein